MTKTVLYSVEAVLDTGVRVGLTLNTVLLGSYLRPVPSFPLGPL